MHSPLPSATADSSSSSTQFPRPPLAARVTPAAMSGMAGLRRFLSYFCARSSGVAGATVPGPDGEGEGEGPHGDAGEDIISSLPNDVLASIISLLPIKEAARTAVLATPWRGLWASNPLFLDDIDLILGSGFTHVGAVTATVSRAIIAHPGPFRSVTLTCYFRDTDRRTLRLWIRVLAAKGVQELVLNNIPWAGLDVLPGDILGCHSLLRLHITAWRFPDTAAGAPAFQQSAAFPLLRDLVLSRSVIQEQDLELVLAWSPRLKTLVFVLSHSVREKVRLSSGSLWCVVFWQSVAEELAIVAVPLLERLILQTSSPWRGSGTGSDRPMRVKISSASVLQALGYLNPYFHELQIGDIVIKVGKKAVPDAVVPSVKILALSIRFGVGDKAGGMVSCFLRCFPNIGTLHVLSVPEYGSTGKNGNSEFWDGIDSVECVKESINKVVIHGFRWENCEIEFLKSILEGGKVLQKLYILQAKNISVEGDINCRLNLLASLNKSGAVMIVAGQDGIWTYEMASDISRNDPFDCQS